MRAAIFFLAFTLHAQLINTPQTIETVDLGDDSSLRSFLTDPQANRYYIGNTTARNFPSTPYAFRSTNPAHSLVRSDDAGLTFQRLDDLLPSGLSMFTPASDGRTIYGQTKDGICISRDGGNTWQIINARENVAGLAIDPLNPRHVLGIRFDEIYESYDEGRTWLPASIGIPQYPLGISIGRWVNRIAWSKAAPRIQVALTLNGLYAKSTSDTSWTFLASATTSTALTFAPPGSLYFSINGQLSAWSPSMGQPRPIATPQGCRSVQTHPKQEGWLQCDNFLLSLDGGTTWTIQPFNSPLLRLAANDDGLYSFGGSNEIYRDGQRIYLGRPVNNLIAEGKSLFLFTSATTDVFITKRTKTGQPIYTTLIGGLGEDRIDSATLDPQGNLYLAGRSNSEDFEGAYGFAAPVYFGFVVKLSPTGSWLGGYTYPGNRAFYATPPPIQLAPNGDVYIINGQDEILRLDRDLTRLELRAAIPQSTLTLIESFAIDAANTIYIGGYDSRPISKVLHFTRDLTPIDTQEFEFGFILKQIAFDPEQRLITGGWFYRTSTACASSQFRGVVLDTRFYRDGTYANLTATCDSILNSFTISPTGQLAILYNNTRLAYVDWINPIPTGGLPFNNPNLNWQGTSLQVAGNYPLIRLLEFTPLVN